MLAVVLPSLLVLSAGGHALLPGGVHEAQGGQKLTIYTPPFQMRYGQVFSTMMQGTPITEAPIELPANVRERYADGTRQMAISGFTWNIVRRSADGVETTVPLWEVYDHHASLAFDCNVTAGDAPQISSLNMEHLVRGTPIACARMRDRRTASSAVHISTAATVCVRARR